MCEEAMSEAEFMPFYGIFEHFDEEEQEHIMKLLLMFRAHIKHTNHRRKTKPHIKPNKDQLALYWTLMVLKHLEDVEEE